MKSRWKVNPAGRLVGLWVGVAFLAATGQFPCAAQESPRPSPAEPPSERPQETRLVIADFDGPDASVNGGWTFGVWEKDILDTSQSCRLALMDEGAPGAAKYFARLSYDVDSLNPAYNGLWVKLNAVPLARFKTLSVAIRGDASQGFTTRIKLELKDDAHHRASCVLDEISDTWVHRRIPLSAFSGIEQLEHANEFVIVFDDMTVTKKVGVIDIDEVALEPTP